MILDAGGRPITSAPLSDDQITMQLIAEMARLEAPALVALNPHEALMIAGLVQLALRHPEVSSNSRAVADGVLDELRVYFAECPTVLDVLERGDDPEHDV